MRKVGIISDTHGLLRREVTETLQGCEMILHGGDISERAVLTELERIAPVYAVRGNNDKAWAFDLPESLKTKIGPLSIYMVHNKRFLPQNLNGIDLVIYGHSHKYEDIRKDGIRYLNPGSCGPRRFHQEITLAVLYIEDDGNYRIEKVLISQKGKTEEKRKVPAAIGEMIPDIMKETDAGKTVIQIAKKHHISEELAEQIVRMYLTHPGVDVDGILKRIGIL